MFLTPVGYAQNLCLCVSRLHVGFSSLSHHVTFSERPIRPWTKTSSVGPLPQSLYKVQSVVLCFIDQLYQIHGNVIYVAMSADASCRGLTSPMDGPVRMEFTEGKHKSYWDLISPTAKIASAMICMSQEHFAGLTLSLRCRSSMRQHFIQRVDPTSSYGCDLDIFAVLSYTIIALRPAHIV